MFFTLPAPLQLWGRNGGSVPRTTDIALLCNKDKGEVYRHAARAYAYSQYEHIGLSFGRDAQNYCSMLAELNVSVKQDHVSSKSSVFAGQRAQQPGKTNLNVELETIRWCITLADCTALYITPSD